MSETSDVSNLKFYTYILYSLKDNGLYIGFTNNLRRRLGEHRDGKSKYAGHRGFNELVYCEIYKSMKDAIERERMLKDYGSSLGHLKRRIKFSLM